jgi:hypothetical protein
MPRQPDHSRRGIAAADHSRGRRRPRQQMAMAAAALLVGLLGGSSHLAAAVAANDMQLTLLSTTSLGGRCLDGSMAGYYIRKGTDSSLFTIYMEGGGSCSDEQTCKARARTHLGSSKFWAPAKTGGGLLDARCDQNPDFCNGTAIYVAYCSGDAHRGTFTVPQNVSWGLIFGGRANFNVIVQELKAKHGMSAATHVMLTGASAGGMGALWNVDFLAQQLPRA